MANRAPRRSVLAPLFFGLAMLAASPTAGAQSVADVIPRMGPCQTHLIDGLSAQLLRAHMCAFPGTLTPFAHGNISLQAGVDAYGVPEMVAALYRAADNCHIIVSSAFRTVADQYVADKTDQDGNGDGCYNPATAGSSRHEWGNAVDLSNATAVAACMRAAGFLWWGPDGIGPEWDTPHFTTGPERRGLGVRTFQRVWNLNHPGDPIAEDGVFGPMTEARLRASPAGGFALDGCHTCDGTGDDDICAVALLNEQPSAYAQPRSTDVNADGTADVCARGGSGVRCWPASAAGWAEAWAEIPWSDASGWNDVTNYATLRMGDVNGDRRADVCARANEDFHCALSNGAGFEAGAVWRAGLSDASGWNAAQYYTTIRLADVNGDGRSDLCARDSEGFGCWLSNGTLFDTRIDGPRWSNAAGFSATKYYGTLRMGDVNGDRRADVCIRGAAGVECALSDGTGFPTSITGPAWGDEGGFNAMEYWSTLRLADVDGDGMDDLCIRTSEDLRCVLSTGEAFGEPIVVGPLSNASGWADITNYASLRVGDIDGDGAEDLCLRGDAVVGCWAWDGAGFVQHDGPAWGDDAGWGAGPQYYDSIRLADFDGDGLDDLCARAGAGWRCHPSMGDSFGDAVVLDDMADASGWSAERYWSTIMSAGHACRAEMEACNGRDDDCDGMVDEHAVDEICNDTDDDCDGEVDEHAVDEICDDADDDCDGEVDEGLSCAVADGSVSTYDAGTHPDGEGVLHAGCGCRANGAGRAPAGLAWTAILLLAWTLRRRRESGQSSGGAVPGRRARPIGQSAKRGRISWGPAAR